MNCSKQTVVQLKEILAKKGLDFPQGARKADLVARVMEANYSKQTVTKIRKLLKIKGLDIPPRARKADLVARLVEADGHLVPSGHGIKTKPNGKGAIKKKLEVNGEGSSGNIHEAGGGKLSGPGLTSMKAEGNGQERKEDVGKFFRWVPCICEELTVGGPGAWKLHLESDYQPLFLKPGATGHGETHGLTNYHMVSIKEVKEEVYPETKPKNYFGAKISIEAEVLNDCTNVKEDIAADIYHVNGKGDEGVIRVEILVRIYQQEKTHQVVYFSAKE